MRPDFYQVKPKGGSIYWNVGDGFCIIQIGAIHKKVAVFMAQVTENDNGHTLITEGCIS